MLFFSDKLVSVVFREVRGEEYVLLKEVLFSEFRPHVRCKQSVASNKVVCVVAEIGRESVWFNTFVHFVPILIGPFTCWFQLNHPFIKWTPTACCSVFFYKGCFFCEDLVDFRINLSR